MAEARTLALDITDHAIAGVVCTDTRQGAEVIAAHYCPVNESRPLEAALAEVVDSCDAAGVRCFLSIGADTFRFRSLHIPFADQKKVRSVVPFEIEDSVSFQGEPFLYDYLLQPAREGEGTAVFAVLVERQVVERLLELLSTHRLDPEVITVSGIPAVQNLCRRHNGSRVSCALTQIDRGGATVFVVIDSEIKAIRSFPFSMSGAEGADSPADATAQLEPSLKRLAADIEHTLLAMQPLIPEETEIVPLFEGVVGTMPATREIMRAQLEGDGDGSERAGAIELDGYGDLDERFPRGSLDNAYALATCSEKDRERINVRKGDLSFAGKTGRYSRLIKLGASLLAVLVIGATLLAAVDYRTKDSRRQALTGQIEALYRQTVPDSTPGPDPVKQLQVRVNELNEASATGTVHDPSLNTVKLLADISARLPDSIEVSFERLIYDRKTIRIKGLTDNFNTVDQMKSSLAESPLFAEVTIGSANVAPKEKGVRFELKLEL
jgi:general secretion pathway protein L